MKINEKISILRRDSGLSQDELAERLNVSRQSVSKWETGSALPDSDKILALAELFDVSTDFLLGVENTVSINVSGLSGKDIELINSIVSHLKNRT